MIIHGDCLDKLKELPANSVDAVVTDPPYGLSFMGKKWDYDVPSEEIWRECLRVLKPGGHLLSFGGTRTFHRLAVNIEDAGFEIRDQIQWIYGSGFPKSHNIKEGDFKGWGTALKPANEPICLARKPLEGTVAQNVLKYGTGAINVDASRIGSDIISTHGAGDKYAGIKGNGNDGIGEYREHQGRWPANVLFDEEAAAMLDEQTKDQRAGKPAMGGTCPAKRNFSVGEDQSGKSARTQTERYETGDVSGASRFFYVAKASKRERNEGLEGMPDTNSKTMMRGTSGSGKKNFDGGFQDHITKNNHPTVKPIKLMEYLIKLITPPNGTVLDPFMGSGSTGVAAKRLGFSFIGIEREAEYVEIAERRIG